MHGHGTFCVTKHKYSIHSARCEFRLRFDDQTWRIERKKDQSCCVATKRWMQFPTSYRCSMRKVEMRAEASWILANEFAQVRVSRDCNGNSARLKVEDLQSGKSICLDPLILASLVWASDEELASHADPDLPHQAMQNAVPVADRR